jgi:hypothetical protein
MESDDEPLWRHVTILTELETDSLEGETVKFLCDYCNRIFHGIYSTVEAHLLKACNGMTDIIHEQVRKEFLASNNARTMPTDVPLTVSAACNYPGCMSGKLLVQSKKRKRTEGVDENHCMEIREHLDAIIARMFYSSG